MLNIDYEEVASKFNGFYDLFLYHRLNIEKIRANMIECEVIMGRVLEYMMQIVSVAVRMLWVDDIEGILTIALL